MRVGINPGAPLLHRAAKRVVGLPAKPFFQQYIDAYGTVTKQCAKRSYDVFIHLPVEFEMRTDGHRPVSEKYRRVSDRLLIDTLEELDIPYHVVGGTVHRRVEQVIDLLGLPVEVPVDEAVTIATDRVLRSREAAAEREIASLRPASLRHRLRAATRY